MTGSDSRMRISAQIPLPAVDVLVLGHILHNEDLDGKRKLIAKAHAALPQNGVLVVYEALIDDEWRSHTFGLLLSLHMLVATSTGFDYTGAECCGWMREAGFRETSVNTWWAPTPGWWPGSERIRRARLFAAYGAHCCR